MSASDLLMHVIIRFALVYALLLAAGWIWRAVRGAKVLPPPNPECERDFSKQFREETDEAKRS